MVVGRGEERLVDRSADELLDCLVVGEHVLQRVGLCLEPELIPALHVGADAERGGLAGSDDDVVVLGCGDGTRAFRGTGG